MTHVKFIGCQVGIEKPQGTEGEYKLIIVDPFFAIHYELGFTEEVWNELVRQKSGVILPTMEINNGG